MVVHTLSHSNLMSSYFLLNKKIQHFFDMVPARILHHDPLNFVSAKLLFVTLWKLFFLKLPDVKCTVPEAGSQNSTQCFHVPRL